MRGRLTTDQQAVLTAVRTWTRKYGPPPTLSLLREYLNGEDLEAALPRLFADGWLVFEQLGKSTRIAIAPGRR